ncbi:MAG TPA: ABC transporter substrate-binding protein [Patescibacteria group bacterium]|nr:ABC transporter substrate-binding protein [Patescibacteria group bacterium]
MILFKKLRFLVRFLVAVIKKQYRTVFLGLLLGVVFSICLPRIIKVLPQTRKTQKIGLIGQYTVSGLPDEVLQDISYGLTRLDEKGEPQPAIAESWQTTNDGKTYIFKLKKISNAWHDGKPFAITDVNYNFKDVTLAINGDQMTFDLKEPFSPLPVILSRPLFKKGLIGLGDYRVKRIEKKGNFVKSILLVPQGGSSFFTDENRLPNKLYRFYNNEKELKMAFNLGEIDVIKNLIDLESLYLGSSVEVTQNLMASAYLAVFLDTSRPPFGEKTFRQALAYAIPKPEGQGRAISPLSPSSWAFNPDIKPYHQDLDHAKKLLSQESPETKVKITLSTFPQYEKIANEIRDSWQQIGIEVTVQIVTFIPEEFDALLIAREISRDPDQYYFWHSTQLGNLSKFKSPRIDKLLEDGRKTLSREERKNIYYDFQRFLVEESPVIFLSHPVTYAIVRE